MELSQFVSQVMEFIKSFSSLTDFMKVAGVLTLVISAFKVSFLAPLWDRLGNAKVVVPLALGVILSFVISLSQSGTITVQAVLTGLMVAGMSAGFHQLLDAVKDLPFVGDGADKVIDVIKSLLGGKSAQ